VTLAYRAEDVVIGIDGGNSKTDVLLVSRQGDVVGHARGPGASPQAVGLENSVGAFEALILEAVRRAGGPDRPPFARHTSACLAGADLSREEEDLQRVLSTTGWSASTAVRNDTFALLRAGTPTGVGVAVVCGAGINCVGVAADGRVHRFPALGRISGDWGGGGHLGSEALWWAVRADDGRGPRTELLPAVLSHFGVTDIADVVAGLHFGDIPAKRLHELCPLLFRVAAAGDEVASGLVERLVEEITLLATVCLRRLGLLEERVDVVLGGGVLAGVGEPLVGEVARRCRRVAPKAEVCLAEHPPVVGAALLGMDALGADAAAEARLRASCRVTAVG
jgi:N-acetylglucosamine kinase-like BadF-type ATPase